MTDFAVAWLYCLKALTGVVLVICVWRAIQEMRRMKP